MTVFHSTIYPELRVVNAGVKFVSGVAEVGKPAQIKTLRGLAHMGVIEVGTEESVPADPPPANPEPEPKPEPKPKTPSKRKTRTA